MSNVSLYPHFSNSEKAPLTLRNTRKKAGGRSKSPLNEFYELYKPQNVCKQLLEDFFDDRKTTFLLIGYVLKLNPKFNLDSKEQQKHLPSFLEIRKAYRCNPLDCASKADHLRMQLMKDGILEIFKPQGKRLNQLRLSKKFYMMFCLQKLKKKRQELLEKQSSILVFTKADFKERSQIENQILSLEKQIVEYGKTCGKKKTLEAKASRV